MTIALPLALCGIQNARAGTMAAEDPRPPAAAQSNLDLSFLKSPPNRKTKSRVNLSSIDNDRDLAVIKDAIDPIVRFFLVITQVRQPMAVIESVTTEKGMKHLRYPPAQNEVIRYISRRLWNWRVIDEATISLSVEFRGLTERDRPYLDNFVFVKTDTGWKFDRHER